MRYNLILTMKKLFILSALLLSILPLTACDKTSVDEALEAAHKNQDILSDQDMKDLAGEDIDFQIEYAEAMQEAVENQRLDENIALIDELEEGIANKKAGKAKGSCDAIIDASTCVEYYGSIWTLQQMQLNCEGAGAFSTSPCPRDMAGGCNAGEGTPSDMVAWMYTRGGGEITPESLKYAKMACDATLASAWIQMK